MPFKDAKAEYFHVTQLRGTEGPINCLAFTKDGKFLASRGDDQSLRIWDITKSSAHQVLSDPMECWRQVTCIKWLSGMSSDHGNVIAFGTGRGLALVYQRAKEAELFKELSSTSVLPFNKPVECMDYDRHRCRLMLCGHSGKLRMYTMEKNGTLNLIWMKDEDMLIIPRSVRFLGKGENFLVFGLECSTIGNAYLSLDENWLLVDNLMKGFDLYEYPRPSPSESFPIVRERPYVHDTMFLEHGGCIACGSDHGKVYLFCPETGELVQRLAHGSRTSMVQAVHTKFHKDGLKAYSCSLVSILMSLNFFMIAALVMFWLNSKAVRIIQLRHSMSKLSSHTCLSDIMAKQSRPSHSRGKLAKWQSTASKVTI
ncbi:WD40-repeat-containing domain protein [Gymnopilus junonius]|uniref:WD40-repeat-containing domain protein n=1 Tax=Gymnopilus junonius TaxID=109634 RepID=A0A9P5NGS9_GYMJU|nr:WD40-repeat-containing domain protein [Gymnopilus junonius]